MSFHPPIGGGGVTAVTASLPISSTGGATPDISISQAGVATDGYLSSTDWNTFNNKQSALTFSTGLTDTAGTITANLSTGIAGGQSAIGGTGAGENLTLSSTSNATKGKLLFGTSAYDEVNNKLGIGTAVPVFTAEITASSNGNEGLVVSNTDTTGFETLGLSETAGTGTLDFYITRNNSLVPTVANRNGVEMVNTANSYMFFGTNNLERMRILGSGEVGIGTSTPAFTLDVAGITNTLTQYNLNGIFFATQDTTNFNLYIGQNTGTSPSDSIFLGDSAGKVNTTGTQNAFIGVNAGIANTTGEESTYIGAYSGYQAVSGDNNTLVGRMAGFGIITGDRNTYIGDSTGSAGDVSNVTIIGQGAAPLNTANDNTFVGQGSGASNTTGTNLVMIGKGTTSTLGTENNGVALGNGATITLNNQFVVVSSITEYQFRGIDYQMPSSQGNSGEVLTNNGLGGLSWTAPSFAYGIGSAVTSGTPSSVLFVDGASNLAEDNANFFWNNTSKYLGIQKNNPAFSIDSVGTINSDTQYNHLGLFLIKQDVPNTNLISGYNAVSGSFSGTGNTVYGINAGQSITSGSNGVYIGTNAGGTTGGAGVQSGNKNTVIGWEAGKNLGDTTSESVIIGAGASINAFTGGGAGPNNSVIIGTNSAPKATGIDNIYIGDSVATNMTTGSNNTIIGKGASSTSLAENNITAIGYMAGAGVSQDEGLYIGSNAGNGLLGFRNQVIGTFAGRFRLGNDNTIFGHQAGQGNAIGAQGSQNVFMGTSAGQVNQGDSNNFFGYFAGVSNSTGSQNLFFGRLAGAANTTGLGNIFIGDASGSSSTTASYNLGIGENTLASTTTGTRNIAIGRQTGAGITSSLDNTLIGYNTAPLLLSGSDDNVIVGNGAGASLTTGNLRNVIIGKDSARLNNGSFDNVVIGYNAMTNGGLNQNVVIGSGAGVDIGNDSVVIGYNALNGAVTVGGTTTVIGSSSGNSLSSLSSNHIFIGYDNGNGTSGGAASSTATDTIIIGLSADDGNFSNTITMGKFATATKINQFVVGGTTSPISDWQINTVDYVMPSSYPAGTPSYFQNDGAGNLTWTTAGVPAYGELYENGGTTAITITTAGTYYQWQTATTGLSQLTTPSATTDDITVDTGGDGVYKISASVSFMGTNGAIQQYTIFLNGNPTHITAKNKIQGAIVSQDLSMTGLLNLVATDVIDLRVTSDGNGDTSTPEEVGLVINRID